MIQSGAESGVTKTALCLEVTVRAVYSGVSHLDASCVVLDLTFSFLLRLIALGTSDSTGREGILLTRFAFSGAWEDATSVVTSCTDAYENHHRTNVVLASESVRYPGFYPQA